MTNSKWKFASPELISAPLEWGCCPGYLLCSSEVSGSSPWCDLLKLSLLWYGRDAPAVVHASPVRFRLGFSLTAAAMG